jgi:hypothetical protein
MADKGFQEEEELLEILKGSWRFWALEGLLLGFGRPVAKLLLTCIS